MSRAPAQLLDRPGPPPARPTAPAPPKYRRTKIVLAVLGVFIATSSLGMVFAVLVLMAFTAVLAWRHPAWAAVALIALVPINRFLILLVFHYGHSAAITSLAQLWKDMLILLLSFRALDDVIMRRRPKLHYLDALVGAFLVISLVFLIYPGNTGQIGFLDRLLGFRADSYFMLAYFVGRGLVFTRKQVHWLLVSLVPGSIIVSIIAGMQFAWPDWFNRFFNKIGFTAFINSQSQLGEVEVVKSRGISGVDLPRASSLLLGDLALAFFSILAISIGAALFFSAKTSRARWGYGAFTMLSIAGMAFTVTRSAIITTAVMLVVMAIVAGRVLRLTGLIAVVLVGFLFALVSGFLPIKAVEALTNPHERSVQAHGGAISDGLKYLDDDPMGRGLGTTGTIGQRVFREAAITTENWYLQIAIEMGIIPGLLFVALSADAAIEALVSFVRVRDQALRTLCLAVVGGSVGFFVIGNMLSAWEVPVIAMAFWMLAGVAVGARETDVDPEYQVSP